jgi:peptide/nickel transport system substrate-binding protein
MASREHERLSRRDLLLRGGAAVGALAAADLLAACGGGDDEAAPSAATGAATGETAAAADISKRFDEVRLGTVAPFLSLDPAKGTSGEFSVMPHFFEPLTHRDTSDRSLVPALASGPLERMDDLTWRATLREGRTFSDGSPITAEDVQFSFDRINDPEFASPFKDYVAFIESVTAVDPQTVEIKAKVPTDLVPDRMPMIRVVPKAVVEAKGNEAFGNNPEVGSGAMFNVQPYDPNTVVLERYEDYDGPLPVYTDKATWTYVPEAQARIAQAEAGQLDIIDGLPPSLYDAVRNSDNLELGVTPLDQTTFLQVAMFNSGKKPWNDRRVRQAWMHAVDRQQLVDVGLLGNGKVTNSPLPESHEFYAEPSVTYEHDPERARSLLAEAGYPDGVTFEQLVASWDYVKPMAPLLEQQLKPAGFTARLKVVPIDTYFAELFKGNFDAFTFTIGFEVFSPDVDMLLRGWWNTFFSEKVMFWTTPEAKRLQEALDEALGEQDTDRKKELYAEAQQIIAEEAATCPLLFQPFAFAWRKEMVGFKPPLTLGLKLYDAHPV